jgi:hypothetical protein
MKNISFIILAVLFSVSCSSFEPVNDFFGIQMNPLDEQSFTIIGYDNNKGIQYQSSAKMDAAINAWAEIGVEDITLKIVNNSPREIPLNYDIDSYVIITNEKDYIVNKGNRYNYFYGNKIEPNSSDEVKLKIPSDFAQDFVKREGALLKKDILGDVSKNWSQQSVLRENVKYILIKLSDITLLLKKVPESK